MPNASRPPATRLGLLSLIALFSTALTSPALSAQETPPTPAEQAQQSAVATPFVGSHPIWCTERNPGVSCTNHHRTPAIDVGMEIGVPIHAAGTGVVVETEPHCRALGCRGGAGLFVEIGHADGRASRYLHLDAVFVDVGETVEVGQLVGLSGATGQSSSPHLHYDEKDDQYPFGSRTAPGPWLSCVAGEVRQYPDFLGFSDWKDVPFGSIVENEGYGCLGGVEFTSPQPVLITGESRFGLAVPADQIGSAFEVEISTIGEATDISVVALVHDRLHAVATIDGTTYSIRMRTMIGSEWSEWSAP
ncbi:MAG: M23 family metallopeptidase, partial [Acidimicrobiales bacterium]